MDKPSLSFFVMNFILLFAVISFILIVFDLHRFAFVFELMLLLVFISLFAFAMFIIYHNKKWGWTLLGAALILLLVNTFFIFLLTRRFETTHLTTVLFSLAGLVITFINLKSVPKEPESLVEEFEKTKDYYPYIDKMEPELKEIHEPKIEKTFTPGKFIASKKANKFHIAKCDWAKRISKENQLWFNSEDEAKAQGFEADKCVS
jgi:hypothetical protein